MHSCSTRWRAAVSSPNVLLRLHTVRRSTERLGSDHCRAVPAQIFVIGFFQPGRLPRGGLIAELSSDCQYAATFEHISSTRKRGHMLTIWGRQNSVNVQKVLWCCDELNLPFHRIDAGLEFGQNGEPVYLAMNPNGRVPTLVDDDFVLWESNSIIRYLAMQYGESRSTLYPQYPKLRASIDRWLDWTLSTLQPAERPVFWGFVRTAAHERNYRDLEASARRVAELWAILDKHLDQRSFVEGEAFSLADLVLAAYARRWLGIQELVDRPRLPNLEGWYRRMSERPAFLRYVAAPLS
jgi:glutathione S-transferase